jgi:non-specific serine/threonine protein kinase/serine/threonine-protein kinase
MSPTSREYFVRLDRLFQQAVDLPAGEEREAFLRSSTGGDADLLRDVSQLLDRDRIVQEAAAPEARPLPQFGHYQARELIGRGGMGTVYRATREDGEVTLEVAVKSISSPIWSSLLDERFRRERQILAQLRHPNIAAFLDGGLDESGLPYLVMELVEGEPIDRYCEKRRLSIRERLRLFLAVAAAVDFAHRQFVVHRDLKPSNILVTDKGEPKLLDFGLARTVEAAAANTGREPGQVPDQPTLFFTPLYASPEVLRGRPAAVTDDVYSLGILLYRLLVDRRPFAAPGSTPAEIVDSVLHSEPLKASSVARELPLEDATAIAHARGETAVGLRKTLSRDLDAIALRSVAPQVGERYRSVAEMAEDVSRYLDDRPVRASAGGAVYRGRKFVRRHKWPVAAAALIVLLLIGGVVATSIEAAEARRQREAAERRFQEARELTRYMMFELQNSIQKLPGSTPIKADMVRHSLDYLDRIAQEKGMDDSLRLDTAEGYSELADVLGHPLRPNLGQAAQAREIYGKAIHLLEPVVSRDPGNVRAARALARARLMLGMSLVFYRQWDQGSKLVNTAAQDSVEMARKSPGDFELLKQAALALESQAVTISQRDGYVMGGKDDAVADLNQSIDYAKRALAVKPGDADTISQLASSYNRLALLTQTHDRTAAVGYFAQALAAIDSLPAGEKSSAAIRNRRGAVLLGMGWNLGSMGEFDRGLAAIDEARATMEQLAQEDPQNRAYPLARASIYRSLGVIHDYAGQTQDALTAYTTAAGIYKQLLAANPSPFYRTALADLEANAALQSIKLGRRQQALDLAREGLPVLKQTAMQKDASAAELNLAARFLTQKELPEYCDAGLGLQLAQRANTAAEGKDYVILQTLGQAYWINRDRNDAVRSIEQALALVEPTPPGKPPSRVRQVYGGFLKSYRTDPLSSGCPNAAQTRR